MLLGLRLLVDILNFQFVHLGRNGYGNVHSHPVATLGTQSILTKLPNSDIVRLGYKVSIRTSVLPYIRRHRALRLHMLFRVL